MQIESIGESLSAKPGDESRNRNLKLKKKGKKFMSRKLKARTP